MQKILLALLLFASGSALAQETLKFGPQQTAPRDQLDIIVAVVEDDVITARELNAAIQTVVRQLDQRKTELPTPEVLQRQVLERVILSKLQTRAARENGVVADSAAVNGALERIAARNNLNLSQLRQAVEADGFSFASFRDDIANELLTERLRQKVVESRIQISDQEAEKYMTSAAGESEGQAYQLAQIQIGVPEGASPDQINQAGQKAQAVLQELNSGADFAQMAASVSTAPEALEGGDLGWLNRDQLPTRFADAIVALSPGELTPIMRSPLGFHIIQLIASRGEQKQLITQTNARHILLSGDQDTEAEKKLRLERLRDRIEGGEDFAKLAKANSEDTSSGVKGGDLGWISPGQTVPEFEQQMAKLQPGQMSPVFKSRFGWHLVEVLDRREQDITDASRRQVAKQALFKRRAGEEWDLWLQRLRDEAYVDIRM